MSQTPSDRTDILIAGGGFAGLGLAVALKDALGGAFAVTVVDPTLGAGPSHDGRASAIAAAARRFFERVGAWDAVAAEAQPILDMVVTDSRLDDPIRPSLLTFDGEVAPGEPFAHMIENRSLINALTARAEALGVALVGGGTSVVQLRHEDEACLANLSTAKEISARLVVAADGARSRLREAAGIAMQGWDYGQSGIVTTVEHERDHDGRAEEHFLPAGPFAILPLKGRRSSIVWTEASGEAERLVALDDAAFHAELEKRFGLKLGEIKVAGPRKALPLAMRIARSFVADRLALVGDAAHVIHPIAGQGLNLGVRDVAALAECVIDQARLGLDVGAPAVLERYQRWRRFDTVTMGVATDGLNRLFSNENAPLRFLRDVGLGLVDRLPAAKRFFIREAAGLTGETPRLLR
ncbi:ubiquinone biosynthesis hydroxylase [Labrys wisconsinensis]|uniref:2-octaprenyl-6-methoxyphenol hydroxylase n=1 Tax=Labrys wisconsinensis TaxID=425677 RepID=A0ABU0J9Z9_9HYPH|nr:ubiquinone biosynthesis hydroxylase [Labrys wisconsinensis]MDQ0471083.1 2-octaprenyl-6-methoxyphenol hydroxylase [Labrys wisconsinensis]